MKLTASQLKQIIKEELGSMHEGSGFDGKRHKLNKSEDGQRILFTKDFLKADGSKDPMSSAKNVPASFADGYHSRAVDFVEWFEDVPLGVEDEEISYMRENSEASGGLPIDKVVEVIHTAIKDINSFGAVLSAVAAGGYKLKPTDPDEANRINKVVRAIAKINNSMMID